MNSNIKLISSGFNFIDNNWGGLYVGGSYLLIGSKKSGRTLLGLQYAKEAVNKDEVCVYFTNMRPKDLMIQAASINFDIKHYMNQNRIIVVRVSPPNEIYEMEDPDDYLIEYINDIITVAKQYKPERLIFDEITPYVGFEDLDLLEKTFIRTLEIIEDRDITSMFVIGEPATNKAEEIVEIIARNVTGTILLEKDGKLLKDEHQGGFVTIKPNIGHTEGQFMDNYSIEPQKGITTFEPEPYNVETEEITKPIEKKDEKQLLRKTKITPEKTTQYDYSNVYNYDDFTLLLNNQIALYKSTGQTFDLLSLKLSQEAHLKGLLTLSQLKETVRLSCDKKDKICLLDNTVLVLIVKSDSSEIVEFLNKIKNHIPIKDAQYIEQLLKYISILNIEVDESVNSADDLIRFAKMPGEENSYTPLLNLIA